MFRNIFSTIEGVTTLPIIGMLIFLAMFIIIVVYVIKLDKNKEKTWAEMPFEEKNNSEIKL